MGRILEIVIPYSMILTILSLFGYYVRLPLWGSAIVLIIIFAVIYAMYRDIAELNE